MNALNSSTSSASQSSPQRQTERNAPALPNKNDPARHFSLCTRHSALCTAFSNLPKDQPDVIPNRLPELRMPARVGVSLRRDAAQAAGWLGDRTAMGGVSLQPAEHLRGADRVVVSPLRLQTVVP